MARLVGASMGGNAIWAYVDQFGSGRLRGVVIVDQTPKMLNAPTGRTGSTAATSPTPAPCSPPTGVGKAAEKSGPGLARLAERLGRPPVFRDPAAAETLRLLLDHALQDWRDFVARIDRPVLMVAARESQLWPCEHAAAAVADNPFGRAVVIEDCGHMVTFDQLDRFNEVLVDFLRTTPASG